MASSETSGPTGAAGSPTGRDSGRRSEPVHHDAATHRFSTRVDGFEAVLDYRRAGDLMYIEHTGVPREIGGRGVAGTLVRAAFDHARQQGWRVRPTCSYADVWVQRHPEYQSLLA